MKKDRFRKLNRAGIDKFADYIRAGAVGAAPVDLLTNPETSAPLEHVVFRGRQNSMIAICLVFT